jgi:Flp pilus assembly protein TadD
MRVPGLPVEEVFKRVRVAVRAKTQGKQTPWEESSLTGDFYFTGPEPKAASPAASAASAPTHSVINKELAGSEQHRSNVALDRLSAARIQAATSALYSRVQSYKKDDYAVLVAVYRDALRLEPKNATHHYALANALKRKAEWDWLQSARAQDKTRKQAERKKLFFAVLGSLAAGMATAAIVPGSPQPPVPDWTISRAGLPPYNVGEEIISELEAAARLNPRNAQYHNELGLVVFDSRTNLNVVGTPAEEQVKAKAEAAFRQAVRLEPANSTFLSNLGRVLNAEGKWADAEAEYRQLIALEPSNPAHRLGLLMALDGQERWTDAALVYLEMQRLKPDAATKAALLNEIDGKKALKQEINKLKKSKR